MSTRRTRLPLLLSAALVLPAVSAPGATAATCQGAPGASAVEQYCEAIPSANGGRQTSGGKPKGSKGSSGVSASTSQALAAAGADGAALNRLVGGDGSSTSKGKSKAKKKRPTSSKKSSAGSSAAAAVAAGSIGGSGGSGGSGSAGAPKNPADPSGSPLSAAKNAVSSGPAAGQAVAWSIVGLSVLGAIGAIGLRRQRGSLPPVGEGVDAPAGAGD